MKRAVLLLSLVLSVTGFASSDQDSSSSKELPQYSGQFYFTTGKNSDEFLEVKAFVENESNDSAELTIKSGDLVVGRIATDDDENAIGFWLQPLGQLTGSFIKTKEFENRSNEKVLVKGTIRHATRPDKQDEFLMVLVKSNDDSSSSD